MEMPEIPVYLPRHSLENLGGLSLASRVKISASQTCVVMYVDMVDFTKITCRISSSDKLRLFCETFINTISDVASLQGAIIVKTGGDSIISYFPETTDSVKKSSLEEMLNSGLEILNARSVLNFRLQSAGLPTVSYRVSADYGKHEIVKDSNGETVDLYSPTMCICSKINRLAPSNNMVIGGDLHEIVKSLSGLSIRSYGEYKVDEKRAYPIFIVSKRLETDYLQNQLPGVYV